MENEMICEKFEYRREEGVNPFMGFMSFQLFGNDVLYSDSVVRPENNRTETERNGSFYKLGKINVV